MLDVLVTPSAMVQKRVANLIYRSLSSPWWGVGSFNNVRTEKLELGYSPHMWVFPGGKTPSGSTEKIRLEMTLHSFLEARCDSPIELLFNCIEAHVLSGTMWDLLLFSILFPAS